jgi:23S rRNA pseudouridine1911/1915/1917 synthase
VRLDLRIARAHSLSRRKAQEYVETGRVDVDGIPCREPGRSVGEESRIVLDVNRPPVGSVRTRLVILHEDADLVIADKPAGLLTLSTEAGEKDTLLSRVNAYLQFRYRKRPYVGVVHRLDKETSGAVVFARSREVLRGLQELFRRHDVEREYVALVEGRVHDDAGTIGLEVVRDRGDRRRGTARPGEKGIRAVTHYRVLERFAGATALALTLETGRTHQIRIHLAALGHPVIGDEVYRPRHFSAPTVTAERQMLHARTLGFRHPSTGAAIRVQSDPPSDFRDLRSRLARSTPPNRKAPAPPEPPAQPQVPADRPRGGANRTRGAPPLGKRRPGDKPRGGAIRGDRPRRGSPGAGMPRAAAPSNRKPPSRRPAR